ncbi:MAG TPA: response regulator transcription factor [Trueperaceae bacterium]|nr:response regulator transcription factor [Trueperaceae bacterium]
MDSSRASVLIVSRDERLLARLGEQCRRERLGAMRAGSVLETTAMVRGNAADVVAIDLALPDEDGFDVVRRLRQVSEVPMVLLSEDGAGAEEEVGLALGADDFVPRSVSPRLFVARVKALLRRARPAPRPTLLRLGRLQLDAVELRATVDGRDVGLTLAELRLLEALLRSSGGVLTRRRLLEATGSERGANERTVDVHVANIRRKLARFALGGLLQTVRGVGYRLTWPAGPEAAMATPVASAGDGGP